jgi:hypothetical protein
VWISVKKTHKKGHEIMFIRVMIRYSLEGVWFGGMVAFF